MKDSKYKIIAGILVAIVIVGGALYYYDTPPTFQTSITNAVTVHQISLYEDRADPNELIIKLGDKVQFNSTDGQNHNISRGKGNDYGHVHEHAPGASSTTESGSFGVGEGYLVSFTQIGTYYFHDHFDPDAFITILVYEER